MIMKKLLVLVLVLGLSASAGAVLVDRNCTWSVVGGQLIGTGTSLATYDGYVDYDNSLILPDPSSDNATKNAGLWLAAGNYGSVQNFGNQVWSTHAEEFPAGGGGMALGKWFSFDIQGAGWLTIWESQGVEAGDIYVPEPVTVLLLGLGGLFLRRRR
jgi:hypothetical protein